MHATQVFLRKIASKFVKGEVSMADLEDDVKRKFGVDMKGAMAELQVPMNESIEIYRQARTHLAHLE